MTTTLEDAREVQLDTHFEAALLPLRLNTLLLKLAQRVWDSVCAADQNLGRWEEEMLRGSHEVFRQMLEKAALTVRKMPATEAQQGVERLAGIKISAATLGAGLPASKASEPSSSANNWIRR